MKKCAKCGVIKSENSFYPNKRKKDGLNVYCKDCMRLVLKRYYSANKDKILTATHAYRKKTLTDCKTNLYYFIMKLYHSMYSRANCHIRSGAKGKGICSRADFYKFSEHNPALKNLFYKWQESGYKRGLTPSVDRISNDGGYSLGNIQFLTLDENIKKR